MNVTNVGNGKVYLLAGGGKIYSEMVAKFCRSEKSVEEIIAEPYIKNLLKSLIHSGHQAALEFDEYIFGIEGFARVTEVELVRKRHASYMIKSGRPNKGGKRSFDMVIPRSITNNRVMTALDPQKTSVRFKGETVEEIVELGRVLEFYRDMHKDKPCMRAGYQNPDTGEIEEREIGLSDISTFTTLDTYDLLSILELWYANGVACGLPEEELRYMKPQATEFKAAVKMNASGLFDWFKIRLCNRAQTEIRDLGWKMYHRLMEVHPDIFEEYGPSCKVLGYCPEIEQCAEFKGIVPTKKQALALIREHFGHEGNGPLQTQTNGSETIGE